MKNNFSAKHAHRFNKAAIMTDRKREERKGYRKHKAKNYGQTECCTQSDDRRSRS